MTSSHFEPGKVVADKYVVEEVLGEGASGVVYVANCQGDEEDGHAVADARYWEFRCSMR